MFDVRAAKALRPGDHMLIPGADGLRLVATNTRRAWVYRYRSPVDGRMRQIKLGLWPAMGLPAALAAWERAKTARDSGADLALEKRGARHARSQAFSSSAYTVRRACDEYLERYSSAVTQKTYLEAARILSAELDPLEHRPCSSITRADAFDLLEPLQTARPVVGQRLRQLLGAVWDRALDSGRLPADCPNWWRLVLRGKMSSKGKKIDGSHRGVEKRALSEHELSALLPWMPNFSRDVQDALTLILWTCCRGAEVVAMESSEVAEEPDGWWWTIPRAKLKMRRNPLLTDLRVPLVDRALEVVTRRLQIHRGFVFPSRGKSGHIEQKALGVAVWTHMPACKLRKDWIRPRLPVADWAPHDLRRTGRTLLAAMGCPAEVAEAILGHVQPGIVGVYNRHNFDPERRKWLTALAARLEAL